MPRTTAHLIGRSVAAFALMALPALSAQAQIFANTVVGSSGLGSNGLYNNPAAALGQATTLVNGFADVPSGTYHASMVYPAYGVDPSGNNLLVSLGSTGTVTVKFDTPIIHNDLHWYGDDLIVYGNTFFSGSAGVTPTVDMSQVIIGSGGAIFQNGTPVISVSADGINFFTLGASTWYPTNPYAWVGVSAANPSGWNDSQLMDFTKPINPALNPSSFAGLSVAAATNTLYAGSAGGAAFSLAGLLGSNGDPLAVQYIRFTGDGTGGTNNIDAVSRVGFAPSVTATPEPSAYAMFAIGLTGAGLLRLHRRRRRA